MTTFDSREKVKYDQIWIFSTEQMKGEILFDIILLWDFKHEIRFAVFHILLSMQNVLLIIQPVCVIYAFHAPVNSKG